MRSVSRTASLLAVATTALASASSVALAARPARTAMRGSVPRWAEPSRDRGSEAGSRPITLTVHLPLRDVAAAKALVQQIASPDSPSYGKFLTPAEVKQRFAASDADVAAVKDFLTGAGLEIVDVPSNNAHVEATGTLAQAEAAFGVEVRRYGYRGKVLDAPSSELKVPAALSGKIVAVTGLDQAGVLTRPQSAGGPNDPARRQAPDAPVRTAPVHGQAAAAPPPDAYVNAPPCSTYFGEKLATTLPSVNGAALPYAPCGYTPAQYQGAYGIDGLLANGVDGRGVTVAITDAYAAPTILQDANTYASRHGQQPFARGQFRQDRPRRPYRYGYDDTVNGDLCDERGWYGEETLDVEAVHAMAPAANVLYVAARSCDDVDLLDALNRIVERRSADIITNSWGNIGEDVAPDLLSAYHQTFLTAGLEGIGVFYSSGDSGDDSLTTDGTASPVGPPLVDFPSSEPLVTAVGGTSLGVGSDNGYGFETGWATGTSSLNAAGDAWEPPFPGTFLYGGGGGTSALYDQPDYQQGTVPPAIANGHRATPDIAMDGDPQTGMLIGETQTFPDGTARYSEYRIGGTSLSSPLYAGIQALADQAAGHPHGFANPALYQLGDGALRDVKDPAPVPAVVRVNYTNSADASAGTTTLLRSLDDEAQSLHVGPGWDNLTGLGSPNGAAFVGALGGG
jgi:subtilase family serine protease